MYAGKDFSPIQNDEILTPWFDFVKDLSANETIVSAVWKISDSSGGDVTSTCIVGNPTNTSTVTAQQINGSSLTPGTVYTLEANVTTNTGGKLSLYSHMKCMNPA